MWKIKVASFFWDSVPNNNNSEGYHSERPHGSMNWSPIPYSIEYYTSLYVGQAIE